MTRAKGLQDIRRSRRGVILVAALMALIVLSSIAAAVAIKLSERKRRTEYLIGYQQARYACDSAYKYALATAELIRPEYASRIDAPDFSDLFRYNDAQLTEIKQAWADELVDYEEMAEMEEQSRQFMAFLGALFGPDDPTAESMFGSVDDMFGPADANMLTIPGPYGPEWPLIMEPIEFEIGDARVRITIEDENAKLPLVWFLDRDEEKEDERLSVLKGFCAWIGSVEYDLPRAEEAAELLGEKLEEIAEIKPFDFSFEAVTVTERVDSSQSEASVTTRRIGRGRTAAAPSPTSTYQSRVRPVARTYADYARLFAATLGEVEWLTETFMESDRRQEYPQKYIGVWGSTRVNINTAPRHVLEAALSWGGDPVELASIIIERRRERPYESIEELREENFGYSHHLEQVEKYITTESDVFTIRITAWSGPARSSATAAVLKQGNHATKIAAVFD